MTPSEYLAPLERAFQRLADPERASKMLDYMRGQFAYYGIMAKPRAEAFKNHIRLYGLPERPEETILLCYEYPEREWQYIGMELADRCQRKKLLSDPLPLYKDLIVSKSWWDTVDFVASTLVGRHFVGERDLSRETMNDWIDSGNMWLQRTTLIFQLKYKDKVDTEWLSFAIDKLKGDREFFIQKAIGWSLRQHSRVGPNWVIEEVERQGLIGLAKREALKNIKK